MSEQQRSAANSLDVVPDGHGWAVKKPGERRPQSRHLFLEAAERAARRQLDRLGGGVVRIVERDGNVRTCDTA